MPPQVFLSYAGEDAFEAMLLKDAIEALFREFSLRVWTYGSDQRRDEKDIRGHVKAQVKASSAFIMLLSTYTASSGINQWLEYGYADGGEKPIFILLHHITHPQLLEALRMKVLPIEGRQCTPAVEWRSITDDLRQCFASNGNPVQGDQR